MADSNEVLGAYAFDGSGGVRELEAAGLQDWTPGEGFLWIHLDRHAAGIRTWLEQHTELDGVTLDALLQDETRPRDMLHAHALTLLVRGIDPRPGVEPDDMVSARLWCDGTRMLTLRGRQLFAAQDARERFLRGAPVRDAGDLLALFLASITDRIAPTVDALEDRLAEAEEQIDAADARELRSLLGDLRREAVGLRRYLAPQRDVLGRLPSETLPWLRPDTRGRLREVADRTLRFVEDLDALRERASVTQEELAARLQDRMNRNTYALSIVAAVFLPLGFLTGLLGVNVGGIPGTANDWAFTVVCGLMVLIAALQIAVLRTRRWF